MPYSLVDRYKILVRGEQLQSTGAIRKRKVGRIESGLRLETALSRRNHCHQVMSVAELNISQFSTLLYPLWGVIVCPFVRKCSSEAVNEF